MMSACCLYRGGMLKPDRVSITTDTIMTSAGRMMVLLMVRTLSNVLVGGKKHTAATHVLEGLWVGFHLLNQTQD